MTGFLLSKLPGVRATSLKEQRAPRISYIVRSSKLDTASLAARRTVLWQAAISLP
jgi:hypothetical protein